MNVKVGKKRFMNILASVYDFFLNIFVILHFPHSLQGQIVLLIFTLVWR